VETASQVHDNSSELKTSDVTKSQTEPKSNSKVVEPKESTKSQTNRDITPREPVEINLRSLLEAGVHFGHQTSRWNPQMTKYIYGTRNGIHVINLPRTIETWNVAREVIKEVSARGGSILFVGTKKQAQDAVVEEARRCGAFHVSRRWLGGMMTNFPTIRKRIERMNKVDQILADEEENQKIGKATKYTKKERLMMTREREKLEFSLGGIRDMYAAPALMFIIDTKREDIAIKEANKLDIPVVALVDTNCDPSLVQYPIPSNDDGTRAIRLFCAAVADAVLEGKNTHSKRLGKDSDLAQKNAAPDATEKSAQKDSAKTKTEAKEAKVESSDKPI